MTVIISTVVEAETSPPRNNSASSSQTSANTANTSGSTTSLHNASGQASGVTSGYYSAAASPATDVSGSSQTVSIEIAKTDTGEIGIDAKKKETYHEADCAEPMMHQKSQACSERERKISRPTWGSNPRPWD